jgi:hypothetical protein
MQYLKPYKEGPRENDTPVVFSRHACRFERGANVGRRQNTRCERAERGVTIWNVLSPFSTSRPVPISRETGPTNDPSWVGMAKIGSEKSKKGVRGVEFFDRFPTPLRNLNPAGVQDQNTLSRASVASSVMNNFYDGITKNN